MRALGSSSRPRGGGEADVVRAQPASAVLPTAARVLRLVHKVSMSSVLRIIHHTIEVHTIVLHSPRSVLRFVAYMLYNMICATMMHIALSLDVARMK